MRLLKTPAMIENLVKKEWIDYSLELPSVLYLYMKRNETLPLTQDVISQSEVLDGLNFSDLSSFTMTHLLHIDGTLRIPNEVLLISYAGSPFLVLQLMNHAASGECLISEETFQRVLSEVPPQAGELTAEERVTHFSHSHFTVNATSDHILAFDGIALISTETHDMPTMP